MRSSSLRVLGRVAIALALRVWPGLPLFTLAASWSRSRSTGALPLLARSVMPEMSPRHTARLFMGLTVIALGVLFTLDNLGLADAHEMLRWWPVALIAYGLTRLAGLGCRPSLLAGLIFTLAGTWLLLHSLGFVQRSFWELWPVFLIIWASRSCAAVGDTGGVGAAGGNGVPA